VQAEDKKRVKYANLVPSFCFVPVAVETLGALGAGAMELRRATEYLLHRLRFIIIKFYIRLID